MANNLVEPASGAPAPVTVEPNAGANVAPGVELPDALLQVPAFQAITAGAPPAFSTNLKAKDNPEVSKLIADNAPALQKSGFGFYRSLGGEIGVVFNQLYLNGEQLKQADQAGKLVEVAPDFDAINSSVAASGEANPVLQHSGTPPAAPPTPAPPEPPQAATGVLPPPPASSQTSLAKSRTKNLAPGSPSSGAKPGAGRLLNNILRPVI